jgi:hypothetical protein
MWQAPAKLFLRWTRRIDSTTSQEPAENHHLRRVQQQRSTTTGWKQQHQGEPPPLLVSMWQSRWNMIFRCTPSHRFDDLSRTSELYTRIIIAYVLKWDYLNHTKSVSTTSLSFSRSLTLGFVSRDEPLKSSTLEFGYMR